MKPFQFRQKIIPSRRDNRGGTAYATERPPSPAESLKRVPYRNGVLPIYYHPTIISSTHEGEEDEDANVSFSVQGSSITSKTNANFHHQSTDQQEQSCAAKTSASLSPPAIQSQQKQPASSVAPCLRPRPHSAETTRGTKIKMNNKFEQQYFDKQGVMMETKKWNFSRLRDAANNNDDDRRAQQQTSPAVSKLLQAQQFAAEQARSIGSTSVTRHPQQEEVVRAKKKTTTKMMNVGKYNNKNISKSFEEDIFENEGEEEERENVVPSSSVLSPDPIVDSLTVVRLGRRTSVHQKKKHQPNSEQGQGVLEAAQVYSGFDSTPYTPFDPSYYNNTVKDLDPFIVGPTTSSDEDNEKRKNVKKSCKSGTPEEEEEEEAKSKTKEQQQNTEEKTEQKEHLRHHDVRQEIEIEEEAPKSQKKVPFILKLISKNNNNGKATPAVAALNKGRGLFAEWLRKAIPESHGFRYDLVWVESVLRQLQHSTQALEVPNVYSLLTSLTLLWKSLNVVIPQGGGKNLVFELLHEVMKGFFEEWEELIGSAADDDDESESTTTQQQRFQKLIVDEEFSALLLEKRLFCEICQVQKLQVQQATEHCHISLSRAEGENIKKRGVLMQYLSQCQKTIQGQAFRAWAHYTQTTKKKKGNAKRMINAMVGRTEIVLKKLTLLALKSHAKESQSRRKTAEVESDVRKWRSKEATFLQQISNLKSIIAQNRMDYQRQMEAMERQHEKKIELLVLSMKELKEKQTTHEDIVKKLESQRDGCRRDLQRWAELTNVMLFEVCGRMTKQQKAMKREEDNPLDEEDDDDEKERRSGKNERKRSLDFIMFAGEEGEELPTSSGDIHEPIATTQKEPTTELTAEKCETTLRRPRNLLELTTREHPESELLFEARRKASKENGMNNKKIQRTHFKNLEELIRTPMAADRILLLFANHVLEQCMPQQEKSLMVSTSCTSADVHIKKTAVGGKKIENFSMDLADSQVFLCCLHLLFPHVVPRLVLVEIHQHGGSGSATNNGMRAEFVCRALDKLGLDATISPTDIVLGVTLRNMVLLATFFRLYCSTSRNSLSIDLPMEQLVSAKNQEQNKSKRPSVFGLVDGVESEKLREMAPSSPVLEACLRPFDDPAKMSLQKWQQQKKKRGQGKDGHEKCEEEEEEEKNGKEVEEEGEQETSIGDFLTTHIAFDNDDRSHVKTSSVSKDTNANVMTSSTRKRLRWVRPDQEEAGRGREKSPRVDFENTTPERRERSGKGEANGGEGQIEFNYHLEEVEEAVLQNIYQSRAWNFLSELIQRDVIKKLQNVRSIRGEILDERNRRYMEKFLEIDEKKLSVLLMSTIGGGQRTNVAEMNKVSAVLEACYWEIRSIYQAYAIGSEEQAGTSTSSSSSSSLFMTQAALLRLIRHSPPLKALNMSVLEQAYAFATAQPPTSEAEGSESGSSSVQDSIAQIQKKRDLLISSGKIFAPTAVGAIKRQLTSSMCSALVTPSVFVHTLLYLASYKYVEASSKGGGGRAVSPPSTVPNSTTAISASEGSHRAAANTSSVPPLHRAIRKLIEEDLSIYCQSTTLDDFRHLASHPNVQKVFKRYTKPLLKHFRNYAVSKEELCLMQQQQPALLNVSSSGSPSVGSKGGGKKAATTSLVSHKVAPSSADVQDFMLPADTVSKILKDMKLFDGKVLTLSDVQLMFAAFRRDDGQLYDALVQQQKQKEADLQQDGENVEEKKATATTTVPSGSRQDIEREKPEPVITSTEVCLGLKFSSFLDLLSSIACYRNPSPFLPLHLKVEEMLQSVLSNRSN